MEQHRRTALLWLMAGAAFIVAGLLLGRFQIGFFAVAILDFAVAIVTLRRGRSS
ncbi:MAG TPA: hypothetical protein VMG41_15605 [Gemmatimonadales bacterium]|nr:hypothetical protein [Gemmatimonadales bacterium]